MKNRNNLLFLVGLVVMLISCSQSEGNEKKTSFTTITGSLEGGSDKLLFINKINNKSKGEILDTIMIQKDGTFSHILNQPLALDYYVITAKNRQQFYLITDSTESITINGDYSKLNRPEMISGSEHTDVYRAIFEKVDNYRSNLKAIDDRIIAAETIAEKKTIALEKNDLRDSFRGELNEFIEQNAASPGIAAFYDGMNFTKEPELSASIINKLAKSIPNSNYYKAREKQVKEFSNPNVKRAKSPDIGKVAPNIVLDDPSGKELSLYELRGKTVLVDFWASWCGPCRRENPNVVKAYEKYHQAGFEVLSVSLDSSKEKWVKAIEEDGLIWDTHVSDLLKWGTPYKEKYGFSGIPHAVLVDKEGTIIDSKVRGAKLEEQLEQIFGY